VNKLSVESKIIEFVSEVKSYGRFSWVLCGISKAVRNFRPKQKFLVRAEISDQGRIFPTRATEINS
jgi:hypothetical protein